MNPAAAATGELVANTAITPTPVPNPAPAAAPIRIRFQQPFFSGAIDTIYIGFRHRYRFPVFNQIERVRR
jgi:hypothetical protein